MDSVWALIPAAGRGVRMGGRSKQFRTLGDASVVLQTACAFAHHPEVTGIVIAVPPESLEKLQEDMPAAEITTRATIIRGGSSRQETVQRLLQAPQLMKSDGVLVHDAVRPFLSTDLLTRLIDALKQYGAAAPAINVRDTLRKKGGKGSFGETLPRKDLLRMQTPQAFTCGELRGAHRQASEKPVTDDVELVQRVGTDVRIVRGESINFKITTPDDWKMAQALWPWWVETERANW